MSDRGGCQQLKGMEPLIVGLIEQEQYQQDHELGHQGGADAHHDQGPFIEDLEVPVKETRGEKQGHVGAEEEAGRCRRFDFDQVTEGQSEEAALEEFPFHRRPKHQE